MESIIIRKALSQDTIALTNLCEQLGYPCAPEEIEEHLAQILKIKGHRVYVAVNSEDLALGWVHVFKTYRLMTPPFAELGGLVVSDSDQGRGIGSILLDKAVEWARLNGCTSMRIRSNILRKEAHQFYEHKGFHLDKTQQVFVKDVNSLEV